MEVHRQTCQACGSHQMRNLLQRESGVHDRVFVECVQCGELVARYVIEAGGYYHHLKGYESFLRGIGRSGEFMSGKNLQKEFEELQQEVLDRFSRVKAYLKEHHKED